MAFMMRFEVRSMMGKWKLCGCLTSSNLELLKPGYGLQWRVLLVNKHQVLGAGAKKDGLVEDISSDIITAGRKKILGALIAT